MICSKTLRIGRSITIQNIFCRNLAYVSNKKITRIPSDISVEKSELDTVGNEKYLNVNLRNRNPRNLEQMLLEPKPMGFEFDSPSRHFWNKVVFEKKSKHLVGKIVHHSGKVLVEAFTNEPLIAQHLNSNSGLKAAQILGQVLARRALESGIHSVFSDGNIMEESSKSNTFLTAFSEAGVNLKEDPFIFRRSMNDQ